MPGRLAKRKEPTNVRSSTSDRTSRPTAAAAVRARRCLKLAAVIAVTVVAAAACGTVRLGSAAIVGSHRISIAQLNASVSSYNSFYQRQPGQVQAYQQEQLGGLQLSPSQRPQQVLGWLLMFRVADRMAQRYGISVTPAQEQHALAGGPGSAAGQRLFAAALGAPPDHISSLKRYLAIEEAVSGRINGGKAPAPGSPAQMRLLSQLATSQCRAAKSLNIRVNPQFGQFSYKPGPLNNYTVVAAPSDLSRPQGSTASPQPSATPPC